MMRSKERLRQCAAILGLLYILLLDPAIVMSAPLTVNDMHFDGGCYYNLELYRHGEQIRTNEPCLNCTCTNRMLMCYLNTCPYSKPIGSDCEVERLEGQCCPSIKCPEVPVLIPDVLPFVSVGKPPSTTEAPLSPTTAAPSHSLSMAAIEEGCFIEDLLYPEGSLVPSVNPCELCYCIRNHSACVMQNCTLQIPGCAPNYKDGHCCPISYDCDKDVSLVPTTTTTALPLTGCYVDDIFHYDGSVINTGGACEHCYCMKGEIICAVQECRAPEMDGCTAILGEDHCCPFKYDCPRTELPLLEGVTASVTVDHASVSSSQLDVEDREKQPLPSSDRPTTDSPPYQEITLKDIVEITSELPGGDDQDSELGTSEAPADVSIMSADFTRNVSHEIGVSDEDVGSTLLQEEVDVTTERIAPHVEVDSTTESVLDFEVGSSTSLSEAADASDRPATSIEDVITPLNESSHHDASEKDEPDGGATVVPFKDSELVDTSTVSAGTRGPIDEPEETVSPVTLQEAPSTTVAPMESVGIITDEHSTSADVVDEETTDATSSLATKVADETVPSELGDETSKPTIAQDSSSSSTSGDLPPVTVDVPQYEVATGSPVVTDGSTSDLPEVDTSEEIASSAVPLLDSSFNMTRVVSATTSDDAFNEQMNTTQLPYDETDIVDSLVETQRPGAPLSTSSLSEVEDDVVVSTEKSLTKPMPSKDDEIQSPSDSSVIEVNSTDALPSEISVVSSTSDDGDFIVTTSQPHRDAVENFTLPSDDISDYNSSVTLDSSEQDIAQNRTETMDGTESPADLPETTLLPYEETTSHTEMMRDRPVGSVPGEGDCNQEGITYESGDAVVSKDVCMVNCTCRSSIIKCDTVACPIPDIVRNMTCRELFEDGKCCPRFICEHTVIGEGIFSSESLVTVKPLVAQSEVKVMLESSTEAAEDESDTTVHSQRPLDETDLTDSSEEPGTISPSGTTSGYTEVVAVDGSTRPSVVEAHELTSEPNLPSDVAVTEPEEDESVSEGTPSESVASSSQRPSAVDLADFSDVSTDKMAEEGIGATTVPGAADLDRVSPSDSKNDSSVRNLTTVDDFEEERASTALPASSDGLESESTTPLASEFESGQDAVSSTDVGSAKDDPMSTASVPAKDDPPVSTAVSADPVVTEQPSRTTDEVALTSGLPLDEAVAFSTLSSVDVHQDLLTTSSTSKRPAPEFEGTTMKEDIESTQEQRDPEVELSTEAVPTPEIKRNMTEDVAVVDELSSPNATDIPQKDGSDVHEIGYATEAAQSPVKSSPPRDDYVSTTSSYLPESEITTLKPSVDDDMVTNAISAEPMDDDATTQPPLSSLDELQSTISASSDEAEGNATAKPHVSDGVEDHSDVHGATVADSVPSSTTEEDVADSTGSVESRISTKDPLYADEVATTEVVVDATVPESSTLQSGDEPPRSVASVEPHEETASQRPQMEPVLDVVVTTESVVDATDGEPDAVAQLYTTEKIDEDSITTKASQAVEMTASLSILVDSVTTKPQVAEERTDSPMVTIDTVEAITVKDLEVTAALASHPSTDKLVTLPSSLDLSSPATVLVTSKQPDEQESQLLNVSSSTEKVTSQPLHTISATADTTTAPHSPVTLITTGDHRRPVNATASPDTLPYPTEDYDDHLEEVYPDAGVPITSDNFTIREGQCIYESRIYSSAQQIPRNDPCDFCFCFRGDIICLQQSCPPPIEGCFEESIPGFCCPRYECPITAVTLNVTDPKAPPYPVTASRYRTVRALTQMQVVVCEFRNKFYNKGEFIASASGPCMDCMCGEKGTMKCTPKTCELDPLWHTLPNLRKFNKLQESTRLGRNRF